MITAKNIKNRRQRATWVNELPYRQLPKISDVAFLKDEIAFILNDERIIYIPLSWSKKLQRARPRQRQNFKTNGVHVFWDDVDEIIGVKNILFGKELFV